MDWYDRFEMYSRRRMLELGIRGDRVGAYDVNYNFRHAAFFPKERTGGENSPGARINLNSGVLNPDLLMGRFAPEAARRWCTARLRDRIDAVIVHEDIEGQRIAGGETLEAAHAAAVSLAPGTPRPISEGARLILRAMAELGER